MTDGHKHHFVKVRKDSRVYRLLRKQFYHSRDIARVDASPYPYGPCKNTDQERPSCWALSPLSVLHRWTGLTLWYPGPDPEPDKE